MEFLKDVLGDELYNQVAEKLSGNETIKLANLADGKYIPKDKFDAERTLSKGLKGQIDELQAKIAELQTANNGADELKNQLAQIQKTLAEKDAEMTAQKMSFSILDAARKHKAKDPELIAKMVDRSKITEKDDSFIGLEDQFTELEKNYGYMFDSAPAPQGGYEGNVVPNLGSGATENAMMNAMIRGTLNQ